MQKNDKRIKGFKRFFKGRNGRRQVHRNVKDRLFRFLFTQDREALLQLYNALNGTDYQDASQLQVVVIENAVYVVMKNDLAFILAGTLNLYEHQSTYNPNMPVRFLFYLAQEYQRLVDEAESSLYGSRQIRLPTPQCVVFYNGEKYAPEELIWNLSDSFTNKEKTPDLELRVRMLNINYGHNEVLMEKCQVLKEYAMFVDISRQYMAKGISLRSALDQAIEHCIERGILSEMFKKKRAQVMGMILEEFDQDKYERTIREDGFEDGFKDGFEDGREEGIEIGERRGEERANRLAKALIEQNRIGDWERSTNDPEYRKALYREFQI